MEFISDSYLRFWQRYISDKLQKIVSQS